MRSYKPEELFDETGRLIPGAQGARPQGHAAHERQSPRQRRACCGSPCACRTSAATPSRWRSPGRSRRRTPARWASSCATSCAQNMTNFRVFGPDENTSNRLDAIYEVSKKLWLADYLPEDADGGELSPDGRVLEMLSEHTLEGWLEGYLLTGRHGFFSTYEAFVHVIDSMFNQHAKWLAICRELPWRAPVSSLNLLHHLHRLAPGPQRLHPPGSRLPRRGGEQEPGRLPHLPAAGREHPALRGRPLPEEHQLHQRDRLRQAEAPAVHDHGRGHRALHQGHQHLAQGEQRRGRRAGRGDGLRRRHPHQGGAGRGRAAAGALPRPEDPLRQRGGSLQAHARQRASARPLGPRLRQPVHRRTSRSSSTSTATPG